MPTSSLNPVLETVIADLLESDSARDKRIALAILTQHQKLEILITESPAGVAMMQGPEFHFESVNSTWRALVSERDYLDKTFYQVYPEFRGTEVPQHLAQVYENGVTFTANEMRLHVEVTPGHFEHRNYDLSMIRVHSGVGEPYGVFCHMIDVTERVTTRIKLEQNSAQLANTIKELEKERGLREQFVATLTHDLRTPLTAGMMNAQILARKNLDFSQVKLLASRIVLSMTRADRMIQDLLDVGRIKAGEALPLDIHHCDLRDIVQSAVADLTTVHGDHFVIETTGNITGNWDGPALRRVIENLASNAIKYGKHGSPVQIHICEFTGGVEISIHNDGNPIAAAELEKLFTHYKRAETASQNLIKGWGIGLTLVKGIAEAHGGEIQVMSSAAAGTTFTVKIPKNSKKAHHD